MHGVQHHAQVVGGGDEHPGHLSGQAEHAHAVFGVGLRLRPREQVDGVRLSLRSRRARDIGKGTASEGDRTETRVAAAGNETAPRGNNPRCWLQRAPMTLKKRGTGPPMGAVPVASWAGNPSSGHTRCCLCTGSSPRAPWRPSDVGAATVTVVAKGARRLRSGGSTFDFLGTERKLVKACRPRSIKNASIKKALLRARPRARASVPPASFQHVLDRHQRRPDAVHQERGHLVRVHRGAGLQQRSAQPDAPPVFGRGLRGEDERSHAHCGGAVAPPEVGVRARG